MSAATENLNIATNEALITPDRLKSEIKLQGTAATSVQKARQAIFSILDRKDSRLFIVVGPCSIHDVDAALDYARRLQALAAKVADTCICNFCGQCLQTPRIIQRRVNVMNGAGANHDKQT